MMSTKRSCLTVVLFALIALPGCATPHVDLTWPGGKRPPNSRELFYTAVAADFGDIAMCPKIYSRAINESCGPDMACSDWSVSYETSECYFYGALKSGNLRYCDSVESISVLPSNKSNISRSECVQAIHRALNHQYYSYQPMPDYYELGSMMEGMGYHITDIYALEYSFSRYNNPVHRFYQKVRGTNDFKRNVEALPSYAEPFSEEKLRPANGDELLMQMAALEYGQPALCARISPDSYYYPLSRDIRVPGAKSSLRDICFYSSAEKVKSLSLCQEVSLLGRSSITKKGWDRQSCDNMIRIEKLRNLNMDGPDAVVNFTTMGAFVAELQKMGYVYPFLPEPGTPNSEWSDFYRMLEFDAGGQTRAEFLKRAEALPTFTK